MAAANLVRTAKKGRERWVSATAAGLTALERHAAGGRPRTPVAPLLKKLAASVARVAERQDRLEQTLTALRDDMGQLLSARQAPSRAEQSAERARQEIVAEGRDSGWGALRDELERVDQLYLSMTTGFDFGVIDPPTAAYSSRPPRPWAEVIRAHRVGQRVHGRVIRVTPPGADVELMDGTAGYIPRNEFPIAQGTEELRTGSGAPVAGEVRPMTIVDLDSTRKKLVLSLRQGSQPVHRPGMADRPFGGRRSTDQPIVRP